MVRPGGCCSLVEVGWAAAASSVPEELAAIAIVLGLVAAIVLEAEMDMAVVQGNIVVDGVVRSGQWAEYCAFC